MSPSKMKLTIFACLMLISCTLVLSSSALGSFSTLEQYDGSKLSQLLMQEQEVHAKLDTVNGTVLGIYGDGDGKGNNGKQEIYDSGKSQKGKGACGGANIVHRPRPGERNAASLLARPPFFISTFIACVSFALILVSPFRLL